MKIYAITKGKYSDYHICALTVDKDKAYRLREIYSDSYEEANVEEYYDGEGKDLQFFYLCDKEGNHARLWEYPEKEKVFVDNTGRMYAVGVYAKDKEHAEKKAHDMIAEYKARKEGIC